MISRRVHTLLGIIVWVLYYAGRARDDSLGSVDPPRNHRMGPIVV